VDLGFAGLQFAAKFEDTNCIWFLVKARWRKIDTHERSESLRAKIPSNRRSGKAELGGIRVSFSLS